jgi:antitoxin HicB
MAPKFEDYPLAVRPLSEDEGGGWLCEIPDLPGCMGDGKTPEQAIRDAKKAFYAWVATALEFGDPVPAPSSYSGNWRMRAPKSLHRRLAERARSEGVSLNTLAVSLLAEGLGVREKGSRRG